MSNNPFEDFIDFLANKHGEELWVTVYKREPINNTDHDGGMYCALVSQEKTEQAIKQPGWDLMIGSGGPGFCTSYQDGEEVTTYYTNSDDDFLRPILVRDFHGRKEDYIEILEEFRLFHNLYHDNKTGSFLSFDEVGDEVEVIKVERNEVKIRKRYLRSFMAARQMNLLLYFEMTRHYEQRTGFSDDVNGESLTYTIYSGDSYSDGYTSFSRILGKKLIRCESVEKCGVWPFEQEKVYQDFIISGDIDDPEMFSCNPDLLANYFGANPDAPHYLTPVFFRKEVMQKYYSSSDYEITDGHLYRTGAWSLRFDLGHWLCENYLPSAPMLSIWIEGPGIATRGLLRIGSENACYRCLWQNTRKGCLPTVVGSMPTLLAGHGCEGLYVPFPASASVQAASLGAEMALDWVNSVLSPSLRTRLIDTDYQLATPDFDPPRDLACPACHS